MTHRNKKVVEKLLYFSPADEYFLSWRNFVVQKNQTPPYIFIRLNSPIHYFNN